MVNAVNGFWLFGLLGITVVLSLLALGAITSSAPILLCGPLAREWEGRDVMLGMKLIYLSYHRYAGSWAVNHKISFPALRLIGPSSS